MPNTQELTRRIKSIKSTRKITRAMQMVSASKMRKSQQAVLASRSYADIAWRLLEQLGYSNLHETSMLKQYNSKETLILVISSNRGLVGSFNQNLIALTKRVEEEHGSAKIIAIGKKIAEALSRQKRLALAEFPKLESGLDLPDVYPVARMLAKEYSTGNYKKVFVVYNHFISTILQKATVKQLLPFTGENEEGMNRPPSKKIEYLFEPSAKEVAERLISRIIESQLYRILLESDASEHSSRMIMMQNATDAAGELIDDLTLSFNQLRQSRITTELSEITAGKIALEGAN